MREIQDIELPVVAAAEEAGFWQCKFKIPGRRGGPDRLFSHPVRGMLFMEFKRPGTATQTAGRMSAGQKTVTQELMDSGAEVHVCDDVGEALRILGIG